MDRTSREVWAKPCAGALMVHTCCLCDPCRFSFSSPSRPPPAAESSPAPSRPTPVPRMVPRANRVTVRPTSRPSQTDALRAIHFAPTASTLAMIRTTAEVVASFALSGLSVPEAGATAIPGTTEDQRKATRAPMTAATAARRPRCRAIRRGTSSAASKPTGANCIAWRRQAPAYAASADRWAVRLRPRCARRTRAVARTALGRFRFSATRSPIVPAMAQQHAACRGRSGRRLRRAVAIRRRRAEARSFARARAAEELHSARAVRSRSAPRRRIARAGPRASPGSGNYISSASASDGDGFVPPGVGTRERERQPRRRLSRSRAGAVRSDVQQVF
jgi:hypothetical protein